MFIIRLAVILIDNSLDRFFRGVSAKFYGDDDSIAINSSIYPGLTCKFYQTVMLSVGIEYTSATKGRVIEGWYSVKEISFLKRSFCFDGVKYLPKLDKRVILEIARWSESDPYNMEDQLNRFNSSLLEMSNYGLQEFNQLRDNYFDYCHRLNRMGVFIDSTRLFIYQQCEQIKWGVDYTLVKRDCDLASSCDELNVVRSNGCDGDVKLSTSLAYSCEPSVEKTTAQSQTY